MTRIYINTAEAAEILDMSINKVKHYCQTNYEGFPAIKDGGRWRIHEGLLREWAETMIKERKKL